MDKNCLTLASGAKQWTVDLKKGQVSFSVYNVEERSVFEGEKVVFLKNDKTLDLSNGQTAKKVVMVADSKHPLNKTETFYVALSRAQDGFTLYA